MKVWRISRNLFLLIAYETASSYWNKDVDKISSTKMLKLPLPCCTAYRLAWFVTCKTKSSENIALNATWLFLYILPVQHLLSVPFSQFFAAYILDLLSGGWERCSDFCLFSLSSKLESYVEFSKRLGKWCTKPSFISSYASLSTPVSAFAVLIGGSIAKSWSPLSQELSI